MNNPLHAAHYADHAVHQTVEVVENVPMARDTWRLRVRCPEIARQIVPGQFVMVRLSCCDDPLIGRALALYDVVHDPSGEPTDLDVVYLVKGKFTSRLQHTRSGQSVDMWGPLGNGFSPEACDHLILVAGGIGQTPFLALAQQALGQRAYGTDATAPAIAARVTFCYGVRRAEYLAGLDDFRRVGIEPRIASDDGSHGYHGFVTDVLRTVLEEDDAARRRIVCCGPEPMMEAVSAIAERYQVPCQVSLETPMACGIGICFSCVARIKTTHGDWDYQRTCVEGPVFDAQRIAW